MASFKVVLSCRGTRSSFGRRITRWCNDFSMSGPAIYRGKHYLHVNPKPKTRIKPQPRNPFGVKLYRLPMGLKPTGLAVTAGSVRLEQRPVYVLAAVPGTEKGGGRCRILLLQSEKSVKSVV